MANCANKICHFARVDSKYGSKDGQLQNLDKPFLSITSAIKAIDKTKSACANSRWVIYLSPCTFDEDIKLKPFIDLYGIDSSCSVISGNISAKKLYSTTDQVDIRSLTINGFIDKSSVSKGYLTLFNVTINANCAAFQISAGQVNVDNCNINQIILTKNQVCQFFNITGSSVVNIHSRNCKYERYVKAKVKPNTVVSNITNTNVNNNSLTLLQDNLYVNTFNKKFEGLLIPYDNYQAAGLFQTHSDTVSHNFGKGAGNGTQVPIVGQDYSTAFILVRKITATGKTLKVQIHTTEVLGVPEVGFNVFSSVRTVASERVQVKHTGWHDFREIPEALTIADGNGITVIGGAPERSMMGSVSDNKLFASRLALEILTVANLPLTDSLQGPTMTIADNVGFVDVVQAPVVLLIPYGPNLTLGQQITFNFKAAGPITIGTTPDTSNPPPSNVTSLLSDNNIPGDWTYIVYDVLNIKAAPNIYPPSSYGVVDGISSVTFTLIAIGGSTSAPTYFWRGSSTPIKNNLLGTGNHDLVVPAQATTLFLTAWAGGGAGGKNGGPESGSDNCGAGGGAGAAFTLTQAVTGISSFTLSIGKGSTSAGVAGTGTTVNYNNITIIANPGDAGDDGPTPGTVGLHALGGLGGSVKYLVNGNSIPIPVNVIAYTGANGGNAQPATKNNISTGMIGQSSATGYAGGSGGSLNQNNSGIIISGAGGGGAGFTGSGANAPNFSYNGNIIQNWQPTYAGSRSASGSGAGGAGEGPDVCP